MKHILYITLLFFLQCSKPFPGSTEWLALYTLVGTPPAPVSTTKYIFISTGTYTGNLGGITGADAKCAAEKTANQAALPGAGTEYRAMISDGTGRRACSTADCTLQSENINWVLSANTPYYLPNGTLIFTTNSAGIVPSTTSLNVALGTGADTWWTGLDIDSKDGAAHCTNWTSTVTFGIFGTGGTTAKEWKGDAFLNNLICSTPRKILCAR